MIPPELHMVVGFLVGAVICTPFGLMLGALLAGGSDEEAEKAAFQAGVEFERNHRRRVTERLRRRDLVGEPDSELGIRA